MSWLSFGLRDGLLLLVALVAIYLVVMLLRLIQLGRQGVPRHEPRAGREDDGPALPARERAEPEAVPPTPTFEWKDVNELFGETTTAPKESTPSRHSGFGEHLADHLARSDVETEVQRMRDEIERMRTEMEDLRAARRVSPQYAEAMELSQRGLSAQDVADRLGISLAEAELVHALSRGGRNIYLGEDDDPVKHAGGDVGTGGIGDPGRRRAGR